mmetsp:Transcript_26310/g.52609  ORF Transcript_26310/g.52609 Transcript_26310/m.52609 type:complete len:196 (-) Transcript_26310:68-655(-)
MEGEDKNRNKCVTMLEYAVTKNENIQKLIDGIEGLGCTIPKNFFTCRNCDAEITGGFKVADSHTKKDEYQPQVVLCENHIIERETFENTIAHELVHAYDVCRTNLDFKNCAQHACTEIRASSLSNECSVVHEAFRGTLSRFGGGQKDCVQRRAVMSLKMNPNCQAVAEQAVKEAFEKCYADEMPFTSDKKTFPIK